MGVIYSTPCDNGRVKYTGQTVHAFETRKEHSGRAKFTNVDYFMVQNKELNI